MKALFIIAFLGLSCISLSAQVNYVHNPSFEQYTTCPFQADQIKFASYWSAIDSTNGGVCIPEYCNACSGLSLGMPTGALYYQYARTGKGMAQMQMFFDESYFDPGYLFRDYLQGRLFRRLTANKSYCVTFYVSLEEASEYAINHIGAYLDSGQVDTALNACGLPQTQYTPQIVENGVISDTLNWVKIEGSFIANGTESFITIGNFFDKAHTNYIQTGFSTNKYTWYLIDDVSVIESDTKAFAWGTDTLYKGYLDSFLLGRDEIIPGIKWWRDGVLIDTLNAGIWCKDNVIGSYHTYIVEQTLCGVSTYDTVVVKVGLTSINVKNVGNVKNVEVWPNPFDLTLSLSIDGEGTARVYNAVGQMIYATNLYKQAVISTKDFAKGVYFLQIVYADGRKVVRRILKE